MEKKRKELLLAWNNLVYAAGGLAELSKTGEKEKQILLCTEFFEKHKEGLGLEGLKKGDFLEIVSGYFSNPVPPVFYETRYPLLRAKYKKSKLTEKQAKEILPLLDAMYCHSYKTD